MSFIRQAWYAAAFLGEVGEAPLGRTVTGEEIVLYRDASGGVVALGGVCPHRFASLARGRIHGDAIACPYHGLRFGRDGTCVHNPHGPITRTMRVRRYPVVERSRMAWIWMGEGEGNPADIPDTGLLDDELELTWGHGYLHVEGNYQLVVDNLLDLTHVEFMHPFLAGVREPGETRVTYTALQDGDTVRAHYDHADVPTSPATRAIWPQAPARVRMWSHMRWTAPSNLFLDSGFVPTGPNAADGALLPTYHLLTPATDRTTHYFWWAGRNLQLADSAVTAQLAEGFQRTFSEEDEPMVADIQRRMGARDLMDMSPLLLNIDNAAVRARRVVARRLKEEAGTPAAPR